MLSPALTDMARHLDNVVVAVAGDQDTAVLAGLCEDVSSQVPGVRQLSYTDGLAEARGQAGTFFRLHEHADVLAKPSRDRSLGRLVDRLLAHEGRMPDDELALVLATHM